jgi:hypothetical protein
MAVCIPVTAVTLMMVFSKINYLDPRFVESLFAYMIPQS